MQRLIVLVRCATGIAMMLGFQALPCRADLVGYWGFNEGEGNIAYDLSGVGNHGAVEGATWVEGRLGPCLHFDGYFDYVHINTGAILAQNDPTFTIMAWVTGCEQDSFASVFGQFAVPGQTGSDTNHYLTLDSFDEYPYWDGQTFFTTNLPDCTWHHVAVVVGGGLRRLYVDGNLDATGAQEAYLGHAPQFTRIGNRGGVGSDQQGYDFTGFIDEVRVYDHALTEEEIQAQGCPDGLAQEDCRNIGEAGLLFGTRYTIQADSIQLPIGEPFFFDSTLVTISRGPSDAFFISGRGDTLAEWLCDDRLYINGVYCEPVGFDGILDPTFPTCAPVDQVLGPVPARDVTEFIPMGTSCVGFRLADTQREVYGNSNIYLVHVSLSAVPESPAPAVLGENYPNPFNPSTTVRFSLREAGLVVLRAHDLSGRVVSEIARGEFGAGLHEVEWIALDSNNTPLPSGVYLIRLDLAGFTSMRKAVLLK